jgi:arabinan endo-1,5-alpha-L-arabinosidase
MPKLSEITMRDPFVLPIREQGRYFLFGTTDPDCWRGPGIGFDAYVSSDLVNWEGPIPAFRPEPGFWATKNFWAPEAHFFNRKWYLFASFKADGFCRGTQVLVADSPEGPYRVHSPKPVTPADWECLDGTLHVDAEGEPWIVFCHEWVQVRDGEVCALELTPDLREAVGPPSLLFKGSDAPWTRAIRRRDGSFDPGMRVTDGPFIHRDRDGRLLMLWSSFSDAGYAMGIARSENGKVLGPWVQEEKPLADSDSGHGMAFRAFDGKLFVTWHSPNETPNERPVFIEIEESSGSLRFVGAR